MTVIFHTVDFCHAAISTQRHSY